MITSVKSLVAKLNDTTRQSMEGATGLCLSRTHYEVEVEHFLVKALEQENTDLTLIAKHYEINSIRLIRNYARASLN